jgi:hypothetical protein
MGTGYEGTTLWYLDSAKRLDSPTFSADRGMTTAAVWITKGDRPDDGLAYGTAEGFLCIWKREGEAETVSL